MLDAKCNKRSNNLRTRPYRDKLTGYKDEIK